MTMKMLVLVTMVAMLGFPPMLAAQEHDEVRCNAYLMLAECDYLDCSEARCDAGDAADASACAYRCDRRYRSKLKGPNRRHACGFDVCNPNQMLVGVQVRDTRRLVCEAKCTAPGKPADCASGCQQTYVAQMRRLCARAHNDNCPHDVLLAVCPGMQE